MVDAANGVDWLGIITAVATAMTAILTGTGGIAAWLTFDRERRRDMPIVERSIYWSGEKLGVSLTIRNRLPEAIVVDEVCVLIPRRMTVTETHQGKPDATPFDPAPETMEPGTNRCLGISSKADPLGTAQRDFTTGDTIYPSFLLWPPKGWKSGTVKLKLRVSSKTGSFSGRKIIVKDVVSPPKNAVA